MKYENSPSTIAVSKVLHSRATHWPLSHNNQPFVISQRQRFSGDPQIQILKAVRARDLRGLQSQRTLVKDTDNGCS